jgi:site-specific recombinase XerC
MAIFKRGKTWWYEFEFRGQRIRESTKSTSKTLAVNAERTRRRELEEAINNIRKRRKPMLFSAAAKAWMESMSARWSSSNVAIQGYNLKHLKQYFGKKLLEDITAENIGLYQRKRKAEGASNRTINMEVGSCRQILKRHKLWIAIADDVKMLPEDHEIGKPLTNEEAARLLEACRKSPSPSFYPAMVIFANTGLRNAELRTSCWHQVDFLGAAFQVGKAKTRGSSGRVIPLNKTALAAFQQLRSRWPDAKPNDYIFPSEKLAYKGEGATERGVMISYAVDRSKPLGSWKTAWRTAQKEAGVERRIHDWRHHVITLLAETQTSEATIKALSGHLSRKMLEHYSTIRDQAKRRAVELLDSLNVHAVQ